MWGIRVIVALVLLLTAACSSGVDNMPRPASDGPKPTQAPRPTQAAPKKVELRRVVEAFSPDMKAAGELKPGQVQLPDRSGKEQYVLDPVELTLERFVQATSRLNEETIRTEVYLELPPDLAGKFGELTTKYVGQRMALVVDGEVLSAPEINAPIPDGQIVITGDFTRAEAQELAESLGGHK